MPTNDHSPCMTQTTNIILVLLASQSIVQSRRHFELDFGHAIALTFTDAWRSSSYWMPKVCICIKTKPSIVWNKNDKTGPPTLDGIGWVVQKTQTTCMMADKHTHFKCYPKWAADYNAILAADWTGKIALLVRSCWSKEWTKDKWNNCGMLDSIIFGANDDLEHVNFYLQAFICHSQTFKKMWMRHRHSRARLASNYNQMCSWIQTATASVFLHYSGPKNVIVLYLQQSTTKICCQR